MSQTCKGICERIRAKPMHWGQKSKSTGKGSSPGITSSLILSMNGNESLADRLDLSVTYEADEGREPTASEVHDHRDQHREEPDIEPERRVA